MVFLPFQLRWKLITPSFYVVAKFRVDYLRDDLHRLFGYRLGMIYGAQKYTNPLPVHLFRDEMSHYKSRYSRFGLIFGLCSNWALSEYYIYMYIYKCQRTIFQVKRTFGLLGTYKNKYYRKKSNTLFHNSKIPFVFYLFIFVLKRRKYLAGRKEIRVSTNRS